MWSPKGLNVDVLRMAVENGANIDYAMADLKPYLNKDPSRADNIRRAIKFLKRLRDGGL